MSVHDREYASQADVFQALASELRLRLLHRATRGPVTAPDLADEDEFEVTAETIVNNLNRLEEAGFLESRTVRGPGNRPRKEFRLRGRRVGVSLDLGGNEYRYGFEVVRDAL